MNLREYALKFYISKQAAGRSAATLKSYRFHVDGFLTWCDKQGYSYGDLWGVTGAEVLEEYQAAKQLAGWTQHSIHSSFRSLRALYNWLTKRFSEAQENPFHYVTMPTLPDLLPKAISYNRYLVLLHSIEGTPGLTDWLPQRDRLLIRMLFECGPRANELLSIKVGDIDLDQRSLRLMRWKTKKEDFIPFSRSLRDELAIWLEQRPECGHDGLWPSYSTDGQTSYVATACNVSVNTLRNWCKYYGSFLSPGAAVKRGQRTFTERDLAVLKHIAQLRTEGARQDTIRQHLSEASFAATDAQALPYVFTERGAGEPLQYDGLKEILRRRCLAAKLPIFRPHSFRHGCGVHIVLKGGDISLVQKILGHRQLLTTEIYLRFDSDQLRSLYDRVFD